MRRACATSLWKPPQRPHMKARCTTAYSKGQPRATHIWGHACQRVSLGWWWRGPAPGPAPRAAWPTPRPEFLHDADDVARLGGQAGQVSLQGVGFGVEGEGISWEGGGGAVVHKLPCCGVQDWIAGWARCASCVQPGCKGRRGSR